jgi:hypothetical protein
VILAVATLPFAVLTWWSVAVPVIGILLIASGWGALRSPAPEHNSPLRAKA